MASEAERLVLVELVDQLPDEEREVVNGLYWERVGYRELAQRLGVAERTVQRIRDRAFDQLGEAYLACADLFEKVAPE